MRRISLILLGAWILLFSRPGVSSPEEVSWRDISSGNNDLRVVLVDPDDPRLIYIGSQSGVLKSQDAGASYRSILSVRGRGRVSLLAFDPQDKKCLFAATQEGLFFSSNSGAEWKRLFRGKDSPESDCTAVAVSGNRIYLGTSKGLFLTRDKGRRWQRAAGEAGNSPVLAIAACPEYLFVASVDGVFKSEDKGESWFKVYTALPFEATKDSEEDADNGDEEPVASAINWIAHDPDLSGQVYLATAKGVFYSNDAGKAWQHLTDYGLLSKNVKFISTAAGSRLYAIAGSGIFQFRKDRWQELSLGLAASSPRFLTRDNRGSLYAACKEGLFKTTEDGPAPLTGGEIELYSKGEPAIEEVQEAAIQYAEVSPEKILSWRRQASRRALLPKLTMAMDRDLDRTISDCIWGTSGTATTPGKYYIGPDDETTYRNTSWSVSVSWELGDLIWSDDQTNIDVRSRLMVELRDDILDEVTKLYFERLRVKLELNNLGIEERRKRLEKELRVRELTASIDALTGGYFSRKIREAALTKR